MIKKRLKGLLSLVLSTIMLLALFPAMQVSAEDIYVEMYLNTSTAYAVGTTVDSLTKLTESAYAESTPASTFTAEYLQQNLASSLRYYTVTGAQLWTVDDANIITAAADAVADKCILEIRAVDKEFTLPINGTNTTFTKNTFSSVVDSNSCWATYYTFNNAEQVSYSYGVDIESLYTKMTNSKYSNIRLENVNGKVILTEEDLSSLTFSPSNADGNVNAAAIDMSKAQEVTVNFNDLTASVKAISGYGDYDSFEFKLWRAVSGEVSTSVSDKAGYSGDANENNWYNYLTNSRSLPILQIASKTSPTEEPTPTPDPDPTPDPTPDPNPTPTPTPTPPAYTGPTTVPTPNPTVPIIPSVETPDDVSSDAGICLTDEIIA